MTTVWSRAGPDEVRCDGLDENCNGSTDEGLLGRMFQAWCVPFLEHAVQECGNAAQTRPNSSVQVAPRPENRVIDERCDSVDNDCDGETDEDFPWTESW